MYWQPSGKTAAPISAKPSLAMADRNLLVDMSTAEEALMDGKSIGFASIDHEGGVIMVDPECGVEAVLCCCVLAKTSTPKPHKKDLAITYCDVRYRRSRKMRLTGHIWDLSHSRF